MTTTFIGGGISLPVESKQNFDRDTAPCRLELVPADGHGSAAGLPVSCGVPERPTLEIKP